MPQPARPVIIDCDPGTDDAIALLFAFASPELDIKAITIAGGNAGLAHTLANALASEFGIGPLSARSLAAPTQLMKRPSSMHESIWLVAEAPEPATRFLSWSSVSPGPPSAGWFMKSAALNFQNAFGE